MEYDIFPHEAPNSQTEGVLNQVQDADWETTVGKSALMMDTPSRRAAYEANMREKDRRLRAARSSVAAALRHNVSEMEHTARNGVAPSSD